MTNRPYSGLKFLSLAVGSQRVGDSPLPMGHWPLSAHTCPRTSGRALHLSSRNKTNFQLEDIFYHITNGHLPFSRFRSHVRKCKKIPPTLLQHAAVNFSVTWRERKSILVSSDDRRSSWSDILHARSFVADRTRRDEDDAACSTCETTRFLTYGIGTLTVRV